MPYCSACRMPCAPVTTAHICCFLAQAQVGARVVSASYGGPAQGQLEQEAISKLRDAGQQCVVLYTAPAVHACEIHS